MQPSEFWECTLLEIGHFILGNMMREKRQAEIRKRENHSLSTMIAVMQSVNLHNMFHKNAKKYPSFEEFFRSDDKPKNKKKGKDYQYSENEKEEFFRKQLQAYRKMGVKI